MNQMAPSSTAHENGVRSPAELLPEIQDLFVRQLAAKEDAYIRSHCNNIGVVRAHLRTITRYLPHVQGPKVLDWGCYHGTDACVLRRVFGRDLDLHGCDIFDDPGRVFHQAAGLTYRRLQHIYHLPYGDQEFDTVIGSGVLEHVVNPAESLKELHRILKNDGVLIITFAPNQWSVTEFILWLVGGHGHPRKYTRRELYRALIDTGFLVESLGYHEVGPTLTSPSVAWLRKIPGVGWLMGCLERLNPILDRLWPINVFGQNLFVVGRRVDFIHGSHPKRERKGLWRKIA